ncbi:phosphatidylinositol phosphatase PTPRQ-like isoform X2 [Dysidea avara]|uniref:phosphatidylinositol phosphatase PTPRQ-like isoform X2 n=1 Tax=Dysidea avara TaxID=196820 RepID=UPI00331F1987
MDRSLAPVAGITAPAQSITSSMLTINWMEPDVPNGVITHYTVFYLPVSGPYGPIMTSNRRKRQLAQDGEFAMNFTGTSGTLTNLNGSVTYRIQVSAVALYNGEELFGDRSTSKMITTSEGTPTEPRDIVATNVTQSSISLTWQRPDPPNGLITNFTVSYNATVTYFNQVTGQMEAFVFYNFTSVELSDDIISVSFNLTDLRLGTEYQFTIVAYTNVGPGPEAMISVSTLPDAPPTPLTPQISRTTTTTIGIEIQQDSDVNGPIIYYAVIVVTGGDETSSTNVEDIGPFNEEEADTANSNGQPYTYITGIVETNDISDYPYPYIVGDESRTIIGGVNYENVRLQSNTMYAVLVRAHTTDDQFSTSAAQTVTTAGTSGSSDSDSSSSNYIILIVLLVISFVVNIIVVKLE